jgi:hypothetical protein
VLFVSTGNTERNQKWITGNAILKVKTQSTSAYCTGKERYIKCYVCGGIKTVWSMREDHLAKK